MVVLTNKILNEIADYIYNNLISHITVGTGNNTIALTSTDLETPVKIGAVDRNKVEESEGSSVTDNFFVKKFKLNAVEPNTLPVNISEVGIQDGANEDSNLKAAFVFNASTKDDQSQWVIRFNGRVVEGSSSESCGV